MAKIKNTLTKNEVGKNMLKNLINSEVTKKKFSELLGKKSKGFLVSILNTANSNKQLQEADPNSILKAGIVAATLDLPVDNNLGFAYIVPYRRKEKITKNGKDEWVDKNEGQFQLGYKGYIQLAIRSGQYKNINVSSLYEGQFISYDGITDTLEYDLSNKLSDEITHYVAYFKTVNSFEKFLVMSVEELKKHGQKYSQSYLNKNSNWQKNFDSMAKKTVLKLLLSKFGILSIEMQTAHKVDQSVIKEVNDDEIQVDYVDNQLKRETEDTEITDAEIIQEDTKTDDNLTADDIF